MNAQIDAALPRPDGNFWLVSSGSTADYHNLDLFNSAGEHLPSVRLLNTVGGVETPIAASNREIVLRSSLKSLATQLIHFGSALNGKFQEETQVSLAHWGIRTIPVLATTGELLLIYKSTGSMMVINPRTNGSSVIALSDPHSVQAAATHSNFVYLLSGDTVLKSDLSDRVISVCQLQFRNGFEPVSLGVTGSVLFVVDPSGNAERFTMN